MTKEEDVLKAPKKLVKSGKYLKAFDAFQALKNSRLADVEIAKLYLNDQVNCHDIERDQYSSQVVAALHWLQKSTEHGSCTKVYKTALKEALKLCYSKGPNEDEKGQYYALKASLADIMKNKTDFFNNLFSAAWHGHGESFCNFMEKFAQYKATRHAEDLYKLVKSESFTDVCLRRKRLLLACWSLILERKEFHISVVNRQELADYRYEDRFTQMQDYCYQVLNNPDQHNDIALLQLAFRWLDKNDHDEFSEKFETYIALLQYLDTISQIDATQEFVDFVFSLAQYWLEKDYNYALDIYKVLFKHPVFWKGDNVAEHDRIIKLFDELHKPEDREDFLQKQKENGDGSSYVHDAESKLLNEAYTSEFKGGIDSLVAAAMTNNGSGISRLRKIAFSEDTEASKFDETTKDQLKCQIYASIQLARLMSKHCQQAVTKKQVNSSKGHTLVYHKDFSPAHLYNLIRRAYEVLLKASDPDAYIEVAMMYFDKEHNDIFPYHEILARKYLHLVVESGVEIAEKAYYIYAKMCFYAHGGDMSIAAAKKSIDKLSDENIMSLQHKDEIFYLKAEIYYLLFQQKSDVDLFEECMNCYKQAAEAGHRKAQLSLFMLNEMKLSDLTDCLASQHWRSPFLRQQSAPINFAQAQQDINDKNSTLKMRKLAQQFLISDPEGHSGNYREAFEACVEFYKNHPDGLLLVISSLCYEAKRHDWNSANCKLLRSITEAVEAQTKDWDLNKFQKFLYEKEEEKRNYFDEEISEDSDVEAEKQYQGNDHHLTADYGRASELISHLKVNDLLKLAKKIQHEKTERYDKEKFSAQDEKIKNLFSGKFVFHPRQKFGEATAQVEQDLKTINHFSAQEKLKEGLEQVSTKFICAQARGVEFRTTTWSQRQRRSLRKEALNKDHPLHDIPLYTFAAYKHAGIKDFTDRSEYTQVKLEKSQQLINFRLQQLLYLKPYTAEELPEILRSAMTSRPYASRLAQLQQLYSTNMNKFIKFLQWDKSQQNPVLDVDANPLISTGDITSPHPAKYTYGCKPYAGYKENRLRPRYNSSGQANRPYCGFTYLTIQPLSDFAKSMCVFVPEWNTKGYVTVDTTIFYESELSFYSHVNADRLKFVHVAKYPSFNNEYSNIYLFRYGLTEELFLVFKSLITESAPHSNKRRLAKLMIGEYISAYQTLYLWRYAVDYADRHRLVLLYRDRFGNYSLTPDYDINPNPNGIGIDAHLRRMATASLRKTKEHLYAADIMQEDEGEDADDEAEEQPTQMPPSSSTAVMLSQQLPSSLPAASAASASSSVMPSDRKPRSGDFSRLGYGSKSESERRKAKRKSSARRDNENDETNKQSKSLLFAKKL